VDLDLRGELEDLMAEIRKRQRHMNTKFFCSVFWSAITTRWSSKPLSSSNASCLPCKWNGR